MSEFTDKLVVTPMPDGKHWELLKPFRYYVGEENSDEVIYVPSGFRTDFASIPRPFWSLIGAPWGKYGAAAVVHDWCYFRGILLYTRKRADEIFYEAMGVLGVPEWKRRTMYVAIRIFGGWGWRCHRRR